MIIRRHYSMLPRAGSARARASPSLSVELPSKVLLAVLVIVLILFGAASVFAHVIPTEGTKITTNGLHCNEPGHAEPFIRLHHEGVSGDEAANLVNTAAGGYSCGYLQTRSLYGGESHRFVVKGEVIAVERVWVISILNPKTRRWMKLIEPYEQFFPHRARMEKAA